MSPRLLLLASCLALMAAPALAADASGGSDSAPVSTSSQSTDQKIAAWLDDKSPTDIPPPRNPKDEPLMYPDQGKPDRQIHGEVGASVGSGGYRSAYGVATIPLGDSSSATVAISSSHGPQPWLAGAPWAVGPAGPGIRADCVCREAPDGSQICHVAGAETRIDAAMAEGACDAVQP